MRLVLGTLACLAVAGCGGGSSSSSDTGASSAPAPKSSGSVVKVSMRSIQFEPKTVTAKVGQTVEWDNQDSVDHNVVAKSGASFKSDLFGSGKTYRTKVTKPGTIQYECTIHPGMTGSIDVR